MDIHILMIDDEKKNTEIVSQLINGTSINGNKINLETSNDFEKGWELLVQQDFDMLILDIFRGEATEQNKDRDGEQILARIQKQTFLPVIFFSGLTKYVEPLKSEIIRVVTKTAGGNDELIKEITYLLGTGIPMIRKRLNSHIKECMREYFWEFIQQDWPKLHEVKDEISIGYLLARRIAKSFSKMNVGKLLEDRKAADEKIYPMEFYIYPVKKEEPLETGDILSKDHKEFIVITPSCDIFQKKTDFIHLAACIPLSYYKEYENYMTENKKDPKDEKKLQDSKNSLARVIRSGKRDCYYFLPSTHFIQNSVIDFQQISTVPLKDIPTYTRVTKLDTPFAQSMIGFFIRYYTRIGTDDLDSDYIINNLK